jgi:hypothetical protein
MHAGGSMNYGALGQNRISANSHGSNGLRIFSDRFLRYFGSLPSGSRSHFLTVFRDWLVLRAISLMDWFSRKYTRLIFAYMTIVIASRLLLLKKQAAYSNYRITWSIFNAHNTRFLVSFQRASTGLVDILDDFLCIAVGFLGFPGYLFAKTFDLLFFAADQLSNLFLYFTGDIF